MTELEIAIELAIETAIADGEFELEEGSASDNLLIYCDLD